MRNRTAILTQLKHRYKTLRLAETGLLAIAIGVLSWSLLSYFGVTLPVKALVTGMILLASMSMRYFQLGLNKVTEQRIAAFLNATYQQLHASTDLLLQDELSLSALHQLQRAKTQNNLVQLAPDIRFPNQFKAVSAFALLSVFVLIGIQVSGFQWEQAESWSPSDKPVKLTEISRKHIPAEIKDIVISVTPPVYIGIKKYTATDPNLTVPESSAVHWAITFSASIDAAYLITSFQDTIPFTREGQTWHTAAVLTKNGFYQLGWHDSIAHTTDYYRIEIINDQQPVIKITDLNQFTQVEYDSKQTIDVNPQITDDYGLTDAYIIATVSKGSGESVKFREEKLLFTSPSAIQGRSVKLKRLIDLTKMGMEPGDELYFYVEAIDNKIPVANRARTETYFISLKDTAQDVMVSDGGLGVDLMPEYFRSQRQLIIDTEKLIREQKTISKKDFNFRSNELGYDQKVLRLRYGQFMGEEFETGIGPAEHTAPDEDHNHEESHEKKIENLAKSFGHQHDTENEHNLVEQKKSSASHHHPHKEEDTDPNKPANLMAEFMHNHDNEESATFFFQSVKLKLKAALTQMWDAELYLRLNEPQKSLPYQYIALRLLKEISNDSRIYVHRTGFDPPPIKEEKRLTADLDEVFNATRTYDAAVKEMYPNILQALRVTEHVLAHEKPVLTQKEKTTLLRSGSELAAAALENPALLEGLTALQNITGTEQTVPSRNQLLILRKAYWLALPKRPATATKKGTSLHASDEQFLRQLQLERNHAPVSY